MLLKGDGGGCETRGTLERSGKIAPRTASNGSFDRRIGKLSRNRETYEMALRQEIEVKLRTDPEKIAKLSISKLFEDIEVPLAEFEVLADFYKRFPDAARRFPPADLRHGVTRLRGSPDQNASMLSTS
jgi:hypothetical protein